VTNAAASEQSIANSVEQLRRLRARPTYLAFRPLVIFRQSVYIVLVCFPIIHNYNMFEVVFRSSAALFGSFASRDCFVRFDENVENINPSCLRVWIRSPCNDLY